MKAPLCERCGQPACNVNRDGDHTGRHTDIEECLRELGHRLTVLERGHAGDKDAHASLAARRPFEALPGETVCSCSPRGPYPLKEGHSCSCWPLSAKEPSHG